MSHSPHPVLQRFSPATARWFTGAFAAPTPVQSRGWEVISRGEHALLLAPTGSGKTLAAFLWALDRVIHHEPLLPAGELAGVRVLYVSPMKALVYDVERNLRAPLAGLRRAAQQGGEPLPEVRVAMRTGDTSQQDRRRLTRHGAEILVTTPESLFLLLTSQAREQLRSVETVIIDEIHAVAGTKRGAHLALSLERLSALTHHEPQRIGLSATQRPLAAIAGFLGGDRAVEVVDASAPPALDLQVVVPMPDLDRPPPVEPVEVDMLQPVDATTHPMSTPGMDRSGAWPAIQERILEFVEEHRTTIVFANSRRVCERLCQRLNELWLLRGHSDQLCRAHHGSVSHAKRTEIEEDLKSGRLRCIVATSSLELGIDMGTVDLVIQVAAPHSVASGLQRVGRAGHGVGELSVGRVLPRYKGELLVAAAVAEGMSTGEIESTRILRNPLDVLCQQVVAMCVVQDWEVGPLAALVRRSRPFAELGDDVLAAVLDMLSGRYRLDAEPDAPVTAPPGTDGRGFDELRPLLVWDRGRGLLKARKAARLTVLANAGTIPDRGTYGVFPAAGGSRIGELDEEMVHESRKGDTFLLGASTWRIVEIKRDRVLVVPAPGEPGRMPFWRGQGPGRPLPLGRAVGALVRDIDALERDEAELALAERCQLDPLAAGNLWDHVRAQREATGAVPSDRCIVVERFRDEFGDWRICVLCPFGSQVTAPWGMALRAAIQARTGVELQVLWTDDGVILRFSDVELDELPSVDELVPDPDELEHLLMGELASSSLFAARFREAAGRALLLPRKRPGQRTPLWVQRMRAQSLLASAKRFPSFPIILETYRECLQDVFDLPGLTTLLRDIRERRVRVVEAETRSPSPFARSLVFAFVATWLYEGDAPLAERRAAALSLDRELLRELLGEEELGELLVDTDLDQVEAELQCLVPERRVRSLDGLHDLLRRLGDLREDELHARVVDGAPLQDWLAALESDGRAARVRVAGEHRWIDLADVGHYRDALGVIPPRGVPLALLEGGAAPLERLVRRFARTHGPFTAARLAGRLGLLPAQITPVLRGLATPGPIEQGVFAGGETQWCDREVLRRVKRRALARLRGEVEPVDAAVYAAFLAEWMGCVPDGERARGGGGRLLDTLAQLEGCPVPWSELEARVLPARLGRVQGAELDQLCAQGELAWLGAGPLGPKDGRVRLVARGDLGAHINPQELERTDLHDAILDALSARGACFLAELRGLLGGDRGDELIDALWDLVWAGHVSNDTLQPLRGLGRSRSRASGSRTRRRGGFRGLRARRGAATGGRWWRVDQASSRPVDPTSRAHLIAGQLLDRYGVLTREAVLAEGVPGGFAGVYPVLCAMEDAGQVRRGWFVAGAGGAQFALPGAVDRLRAARDSEQVHVLAATDPACAWGGALRWPELEGRPLRREAGATVVTVGGQLVLYLGRGGRSLVAFPDPGAPDQIGVAVRALERSRTRERARSLRVQRLHGPGDPAALSGALIDAGFQQDGDGLVLPAVL
jgi:ATP-dependent Lhr-like helicase